MKVLAAAVLLLQVASQQPYIETFEVRLHNLDVVVTDRAGKPVNGLTKDDFIVTENGVAQEITNFAVYGESAGSVEDRRSRLSPDAGQAGLPVLQHTPRKFIFFIDEMSLHPQSRSRLLKNATAMLEKSMSEGDQAAIVRPYGEQNIALNYTGDIDEFVRAFGAVLAENGTRVDTQAASELRFLELQLADTDSRQERKFVRKMYADAARRRTEQRLGQLRALVSSFAGTEGKKVVVLVTTSLASQPGLEARDPDDTAITDNDVAGALMAFVDLQPMIDDLGRIAAANGVTIYTLQPDVPTEFAVPGRESPRPRLQATSASPIQPNRVRSVLPANIGHTLIDNTQVTMKSLAEKTGGRSFLGDGNIDDTFRQIGTDLSAYYSLAYRAQGGSDQARRVEVRVKDRPELRVRTRTDVIEKTPEREMEDLVVANLLYPRDVNELAVRAVPGAMRKSRNLFIIPVETQIPMERLTFLPGPDGKYHASFNVHYAAAGEKTDFSAGQQRRQDVSITQEQMQELAGKVFRYTSELEVAPGHVKIAVGVLDRTSKLSGFAVLSVWAK